MRNKLALIAGLIILLLVNWSIIGKERHLKEGRVVYLQLAPVDPRSLMQGDYMALNYMLANAVYTALPKNTDKGWRRDIDAGDGRVVVSLDEKSIASFKRLASDMSLAKNEVMLRYRVRGGRLKFATNAFFFEEGKGAVYEPARYGQFRVASNGELLLTGLYDKELRRLGQGLGTTVNQ